MDVEGKVERWAIGDLKRYAKNAKRHPDRQIKALMRMIQRVGFRSPIQVDEGGEIIAGHGRLTAAEQLGMTDVPVLVQRGLTDQQKRELRLADNRLAELAETDEALLLEELEALGAMGFDLEAMGFDELKKEEAPLVRVDVSELKPEFWISVRGPLILQPDAIERLADALREIEGVEVSFGVIE